MRTTSKVFAAIIFLILSFVILTPLGAGLGDAGMPVVLGLCGLVALICLLAPTGRRAWGRGFLLDGLFLIALPLLATPLIGRSFAEVTEAAELTQASEMERAATEVGAGLGAAMMFGAATFVGIVLGAIFVVLGLVLVLGGRREVIVVRDG